MSTIPYAVRDCSTMLRRNLLHMVRYPSMTLLLLVTPIIVLLLFVYALGGTLGAGLAQVGAAESSYVNYVVPGILLMTVAATVQGTAISVAMDMTGGITDRFRTMAIARASLLTGHVLGSVIQALLALAAVAGVALLIGFRPTANALAWLGVFGMLTLIGFALTWLAVALGLVADTVETASNTPMPLMMLPFLSSGFVPTDSMPTAIRWFAEYQPFTPVIETLRGLLTGTPIGNSWLLAIGWCLLISLGGYVWSRLAFERSTR